MEDKQILELYWARSERAILETSGKYGKYCHYIANCILHSYEDSEECVNDTFLRAWNAIPPKCPEKLSAFLGKITRNLSLNKWEKYTAEKRGFGQTELVLEELAECIPASGRVEEVIEQMALAEVLNHFLASLSPEKRQIFMRRYWYLNSVKEIASDYALSESKVKMSLFRSREELKQMLEKEGIVL